MASDDMQDTDIRAICPHEDAVYWNPYNHVVQCHRCGTVFIPATQEDYARLSAQWQATAEALEPAHAFAAWLREREEVQGYD